MDIILLILAILCMAYGVIVRAAGSGTVFFLVWIVLGLFLGAFAWCLKKGFWHRIPAAGRGIFLVLIFLGAVVLFATEARILKSFHEKGREDLDYLIVLGAQMWPDGPSRSLAYRLDAAAEYLEAYPGTVCIVTGGQGWNEPCTEAEGMRAYLIERGIAEERILLEDQSVNTVQNIQNSMVYFDPAKAHVGIVTNNFHLYRAVAIAKKQGIENVCGISSPSTPLFLPNNMFREFFGVWKDTLKGNM